MLLNLTSVDRHHSVELHPRDKNPGIVLVNKTTDNCGNHDPIPVVLSRKKALELAHKIIEICGG